jgi:ABC-2 type transport system ATP-binding protein
MQLQIENLCKRYSNGVQALENVSLTIPTGMFGLLGPNGAGKSTLMRTLATLQEADSGAVFLGDVDVLKEKEELRRHLGYLPQEFGLYPKVTALDMLDHFAMLKGIRNARERRKVVDALLEKTNLVAARKRQLGTFSGGMKQRFGIAQALLGDPKLIIVDEPTAGLDPEERNRFHNLLAEIGANIIVILSTHIVSDVNDLCPQMAILHGGRVIRAGEPRSLIATLRDRVWRKFIDKAALAAHEAEHRVIAARLLGGRLLIHVYSEQRPDALFEPVEADLEDFYFYAMKARTTCPDTVPVPVPVPRVV